MTNLTRDDTTGELYDNSDRILRFKMSLMPKLRSVSDQAAVDELSLHLHHEEFDEAELRETMHGRVDNYVDALVDEYKTEGE